MRRRRCRSLAVPLIVAGSLALAGCGTTVRVAPAAGSPAGVGTQSDPGAGRSGAVTGDVVGAPAIATSAAGGVAGAPQTSSAAAVSPNAQSPTALAAAAAASTNAPILIGVVVADTSKIPSYKATADQPKEDFKAVANALIADLNRHGGLGGHRVTPVVIVQSFNADESAAQIASTEQAQCQALTEDYHVAAVLVADTEALALDCFAQHHTPTFVRSMASLVGTSRLQALAPWIIPDDTPDLDTEARLMVASFARENFIDKHIGILANSSADSQWAVQHVLIPDLEAHGAAVQPRDVYYTIIDAQHAPQAAANAALKWKADGVDRVILFGSGLIAWNFVANTNESQDFHPAYGLSSTESPQFGLDATPDVAPPVPLDQRHVVSAGFFPVFDVHDDDYPMRPIERHCLAVVNHALGTNYRHRNVGTGGGIIMMCRQFQLMQQVFAPLTGKPFQAADLYDVWQSLGSSYRPQDIPRTYFAPGKPDGLATYRTVVYNTGCQCMRYDSPWLPAPAL